MEHREELMAGGRFAVYLGDRPSRCSQMIGKRNCCEERGLSPIIKRREAYRALIKAHMAPDQVTEIRDATNGNFALGGKRFQQQIESALGKRAIRGVSGRPTKQVQSDDRQKELL